MIAILPVSLVAQDTATAMLHSNGGGVFVNKNAAPASGALFAGDLVETDKTGVARLQTTGSTVDINPETVVQFEGDELVLDHGRLSVNTSRGMKVRVGCLTITPVNEADWTQYDVVDLDGRVTVSGLKNDTYIDSRTNARSEKEASASNRAIVHQGEQKSRQEKCGAAEIKPYTPQPALGAILNSPWAVATGAAAIGVLACWSLCRGDDPISPKSP
ncbi:MAG TPA: hypothetical protein VMG31_15225 [Verrucomicrobiae bacterium]|nr:hypothetical protein [Verrucomicrobiae bacterium]